MSDKNDIQIYQSDDGKVELKVSIENETIWLSQQQIATLFNTQRPAITKHLNNIFKQGELEKEQVCSILEHTAKDGKTYKTKFYSLDAIISVGYRVNSSQATKFRIWATSILKEYLIKGYTLNQQRLEQKGFSELENSMALLQKMLVTQELVSDIGEQAIQIINQYARSWKLLLAYDEQTLTRVPHQNNIDGALPYDEALLAIKDLKSQLMGKGEASELFGNERDGGLNAILGNIDQYFADTPLYPSAHEKAAHLLYFVIKNHPFTDGNKRIACFLFLIYLKAQNIVADINDAGMVALALLIAESDPSQKELMIHLISNLLINT